MLIYIMIIRTSRQSLNVFVNKLFTGTFLITSRSHHQNDGLYSDLQNFVYKEKQSRLKWDRLCKKYM